MALHNELGKQGEELGASWLEEKGYTILDRNWRYGQLEIDIIAAKGKFLYFIEIKTRNFSRYGHPEDSVTKKKFRKLKKAADEYLFRNPGHPWIQYHILSVTLFKEKEPEFFLIEDVFL
ncbi:MAG TPA: YraN family protein [Chitinophagaceae bacterium]|jgi:putative endonuclease|nr:YraN family protein [Chitinophagaceae bacterium]